MEKLPKGNSLTGAFTIARKINTKSISGAMQI
jgi:hypothetical protein